MDITTLKQAAEQYGTPCFLFDETALQTRMAACKEIVGENIRLCYSIKANPFLIPAMLPCVELLEVCSPGEMTICEDLAVDGSRILMSGVNKTREDILQAIRAGVARFTAESLLHVRLLNECAIKTGRVLPVLLRLTAGTQFGMDMSDMLSVIDNRDEYAGLRFEGIHYFSGTQRKRLTSQRKELIMLAELIDTLFDEHNFTVQRIEYGPGLFFPYFEGEDDSDTLAPLRELAPDLQALAEKTELTIEMGRFFASECGSYLTTVVDTKINNGQGFAILDGGMHHVNYLGGMMGMKVPHITHIQGKHPYIEDETDEALVAAESETRDWSLCGSLCTTADVLVRQKEMTGLTPGDVLVFHNIGAYSVTEGPALFLSRNMPKILMADESGLRLARDTVQSCKINQPDAK